MISRSVLLIFFALGITLVTSSRSATAQECSSCWSVSVTPDASPLLLPVGTYTTEFVVTNTGSGFSDTYTLDCSSIGDVACVSVSPEMTTLAPGHQISMEVTYTLGPGGGTLYATATGNSIDQGSRVLSVLPPPVVTPDGQVRLV